MLNSLRQLCSADDSVRFEALGALKIPQGASNVASLQKLKEAFFQSLVNDPSPLIRKASYEIILSNPDFFVDSEEGLSELFSELESTLIEEVDATLRGHTMRLLFECCKRYPRTTVKIFGHHSTTKNQHCSLLEGAIIVLGINICDVCEINRALACHILSRIQNIPDNLVVPLLNKAVPSGSEDKKLALPWEFCGSLIIALEDEFEMVRSSAIKTLKEFSLQSIEFGKKAIDFFIDSFQDESPSVRQQSFYSLASVFERHSEIIISLPRLENILSHLDDTEVESRVAASKLLSSLHLGDEECLLKLCRVAPIAIGKYRFEEDNYFDALFTLGYINASLIGKCCTRLLKIDKFFLITEPKIEDTTYTVRLSLILSSLYLDSSFDPYIPGYVYRHYHYMRAKYKSCPDFRTHRLHDRFYHMKSFPFLDEKLLPERRQHFLSFTLPNWIREPTDNSIDLDVCKFIDYNVLQFDDGFHKMLQFIHQFRLGLRDSLSINFEGLKDDLKTSLLQIERGIYSNIKIPYQDCISLRRATIWELQPKTTEITPFQSSGRLSLHIQATGTITPGDFTSLLRVRIKNQDFTSSIELDRVNLSFKTRIRIPAEFLSHLANGIHEASAEIVIEDENQKFQYITDRQHKLYIYLNKIS